MQVRKQQLELDMEQQTASIGNGVHQGCILSPCLFNLHAEYIMGKAGVNAPAGMNHKLESRLLGVIPITSDR